MTLQAVIDCAHASFHHYDENRNVWTSIRNCCGDLLCTADLTRYQELCDGGVFEKTGDDNRRTKWEDLVKKCNSNNEDINSSDFEHQFSCRNKFEDKSKDMGNKLIAYDQLRVWSLYVEHKPIEMAAYCNFLVSIFFLCVQCNIVVTSSHIIYFTGAIQP